MILHLSLKPLYPLLWVCALLALCIESSALGAEKEESKQSNFQVESQGVSDSMKDSVEQVIDEQVALAGDSMASPALADDLAFFVRRHYLDQGYEQAVVDWEMKGSGILLKVDEGQPRLVGEVTFTNNPGLDAKELQRYLLRPTRERVGRFAKDTPFVKKEVEAGLDLVLRYLLSQGYLDASTGPIETRIEGGKVQIQVGLKPQSQWHVGKVEVLNALPEIEKLMRSQAELLKEQVANEASIERTRSALEGLLQSRGLFVAKVRTESQRGDDKHLQVRFIAEPGVLHSVSELHVSEEFSHGAARLVRSIFQPTVNHVYDAARMEQAYGRVVDTGVFEHLEMEPTIKPNAEGELSLAFTGKEAKASSVGVSLGYDTFQGALGGIEYKNVNFWDSGGLLRAQLLATQLGFSAALQWKNPAIFNSPYAFSASLEPESFGFVGYQRHTAGLRLGLSRDLKPHLSVEAWVLSSYNTVTSDTLSEAELGPGEYTLGEGGIGLVYEGRDNPVSPTRGWFANGTLQSGFIGGDTADVAYTSAHLALAWYHPLSAHWRTALGGTFTSLISGSEVGDIPIELRNYNGGANGVRSFAQRELGPRAASDGTPLGGTQSQTVSGEIAYEIIKNLEIAGFVDVGSLSTSQGTWAPQFSDLRYAAGAGLRYRLPFGPLRIDYGVNLNRRTGESFGALHIGFGMAF